MKASYPQVLWRLLLGMHLPIIAVMLITDVFERQKENSIRNKVLSAILVLPLFILLVRFSIAGIDNQMVKTVSLVKTPTDSSYKHWNDLISFLSAQGGTKAVLTDPVTAYAVRSMTSHVSYGHKFFPHRGYRQINFESYESHPLGKYKGWLLVVNRRNGSETSRFSPPYHVYPDIMQVDKYYSSQLLAELIENSHRYEELWSRDKQKVYLIK